MYIFNIKALKQDIKQGKTTDDRYLLPYVIGHFVLWSLTLALALPLYIKFNVWDHIDNVFTVLIAGPAIYYLYRSNRDNASGSFLSNLVLFSWVCNFRFFVITIPFFILLLFIGVLSGGPFEEETSRSFGNRVTISSTSPVDCIAMMLVDVLYILYIARHIRSLKN